FTLLICSGLVVSPLYIYSSIRSFNTLPIAVASLLDFSNAIVLVLLMRIFFKSKITKEKLIASVIALVGISLVLNLLGTETGAITSIGIFWGIINCFSLATAYLFDYYHITNSVSYLAYLVYSNLMGLILFSFKASPIQVFQEFNAASATAGSTLWLMLFGYALVLIISYGTVAVSYKYIEASTASLTFVAEPATAALMGFFILGQQLSYPQLIGIGVTVCAIMYMQYVGNKADERALKSQVSKISENRGPNYEGS
ncbi:MAG: EamA family transporter, partial [Eubacterium sp.]